MALVQTIKDSHGGGGGVGLFQESRRKRDRKKTDEELETSLVADG